MISFRIPGLKAGEISERMMQKGIKVRVVNEGGLNAIRVSFHVFNNIDDADKALNSIDSIRA
jgi:selenocysteine lyase/cysteine desulfurase